MNAAIAALDGALAREEEIILRRTVGTAPNQSNADVKCRAKVTPASVEQIANGIPATDFNIVLSPTPIDRVKWPGATCKLGPMDPDPRLPRVNEDRVILLARGGPPRTVAFVDPRYVGGELVRINLRVSG